MSGSNQPFDPIQEEALDWLLASEANPDNADLQAKLRAWRTLSSAHDAAYRRVEQTWLLAGSLPEDYAKQAKFDRSGSAMRHADGPPLKHQRGRRRAAGIATTAAIAIGSMILLAPNLLLRVQADHVTGVGETRSLELDDGSTLHLDAETAVAVRLEGVERTVRLIRGQAFFDVAHRPDRPFAVSIDGALITVKGTRFAVERGRERTRVSVASGEVEVAPDPDGPFAIRVERGFQMTMMRATGASALEAIAPTDVAAWREGLLIVDGASLAEVIEALGRYHRGAIWLQDANLAERRVTGVFDLTSPIAALRAAASTHEAEVLAFTPYILLVKAY